MKVTLNEIKITLQGKRVEYDYTVDKSITKYFTNKRYYVEYDIDVSNVPESILVIPFLANFAPIAWFAGFDIDVNDLDSTFFYSLQNIKTEFSKYYPELKDNASLLVSKKRTTNDIETDKTAMLFSGGVDAYTTFFRHFDEIPDLITIKGADMKIEDEIQWNEVIQYNENQIILKKNNKFYIESNIRDFYSFEVDKLLKNLGWWGYIQHGLALTAVCAPLAFIRKYRTIYIASSYTRKENYDSIIWGSMPEIDNKVIWSNTMIKHDAEELTRQEKISFIAKKSNNLKTIPQLRVCYSDIKNGLNCSKCEKCLRTIFALMILNSNPNEYGFDVDISIFKLLNKTMSTPFTSKGNKLFWKEIYNEAIINKKYFNDDLDEWQSNYSIFLNILNKNLLQEIKDVSEAQKLRQAIIYKYPKLFNGYLKIRRKLQ